MIDKYLFKGEMSGMFRSSYPLDWIFDLFISAVVIFMISSALMYITQPCCRSEDENVRRLQRNYCRKWHLDLGNDAECWCEREIEPPRYYESLEGA
jgi:hypothetical protein